MRYFMFHKPKGCVTACSDERHKTVMDYFEDGVREGLFPVGRLDRDTEGLLFVTDDGMFSHLLTEPHHHVEKTYFFIANGILQDEKLGEIERGIPLFDDGKTLTLPAKISVFDVVTLREVADLCGEDPVRIRETRRGDLRVSRGVVTLTEGKRHQVKRMVKYAGSRVLYLKRLSIGGVALDETLAPGEYRPLTKNEYEALLRAKEEFASPCAKDFFEIGMGEGVSP